MGLNSKRAFQTSFVVIQRYAIKGVVLIPLQAVGQGLSIVDWQTPTLLNWHYLSKAY